MTRCHGAAPPPPFGDAPRNGERPAGPKAGGAAMVMYRSGTPRRESLSGGVGVVGALTPALRHTDLADPGVGLVALAGVRLGVQPLHEVRVVRLERRPLRTDPRDLGEVVPGRRRRRGPLQRVAVAPRVVAQGQLPVPP